MDVAILLNADPDPSVGFHPGTCALAERFTFVDIEASTAEEAADVAWSLTHRAGRVLMAGVDRLASGLLDQADAYRAADHRGMAFGDVVIVRGGGGRQSGTAFAREHGTWRRLSAVPVHVRGLPPDFTLVCRLPSSRQLGLRLT